MKEGLLLSILYFLVAIRIAITVFNKKISATWKSVIKEYLDSFIVAGVVALFLLREPSYQRGRGGRTNERGVRRRDE